ncbi:lantibiotic biosynthesis dehydratase-like protein [Actinomadura pelletieri DSM 43383]|uniref:Lantibiotic biosynthesis dehydratase-like protein n=1 Tax=Actinomadura pelletieri DSM 43383 TaxID=1120940 RepID=A0A495QH10_9ACTN|nr:lantibiotic biosynthesis dehydratase-like protein [Actinomadura pelletieri DSM 43383]
MGEALRTVPDTASADALSQAFQPDDRAGWLLTPLFMLRRGGLPIDAVRPLRFTETLRWTADVLELEERLDRHKGGAADTLADAVGGLVDERLRRDLLALRRDVFNRRLPRDLARARRLTEERGLRRVGEWLDLRVRYEDVLAAGVPMLDGELRQRREYVRGLARDPRLRHGLLLASPSLDRYLSAYLEAPPGPLGKRARRIERSLLEYVYRSACKTSPFSTFTTVAFGGFEPDGPDGPDGTVAAGEWTGAMLAADDIGGPGSSHVRINVAMLARLSEVIMEDAALREDLPVEATSGWSGERDRIRYVRRTHRSGDTEAAVTFDSLREDLFYLSRGSVLDEVLRLLEDHPRIRMGELAERLRAADPERRDREAIELYLSRLLRLSLLTVPLLQVDIHSDDPLRGFRDRIARIDRPWAVDLAERLDLVADHLALYGAADLDERRRLVDSVRSEFVEAQHELGLNEVTTPRTLVYEDVSHPEARITADREGWERTLLPSLRGLSRVLPLFDMTLPQRLNLKGFFLARYGRGGRCEDVLRFVHEFHRDFFDQFMKASQRRRAFDADGEYVPLDNWLRLPEITALDEARRTLVDRMRRAYDALPADADELVLDDEFIDAVAKELPPSLDGFDPRSFFLQVADDGGRPLGVLNRTYSGLTLLFSRFAHCFGGDEGLAGRIRQILADLQPDGAVFAELTGGYDTTNLNLHPPVTPYELVCPGETSFRPQNAQVPIADLVIEHDEETDRVLLRSRTLDTEVIPVYLGFLVPMALPEVQRGLLLFSHTTMASLDLWHGVDKPLLGAAIGGHPRVRYRDLVLTRRTWKMVPDHLPDRASASSDAEWFLAWQRWRRDNDLPARVFAAVDADAPDGTAGERPANAPRKPQYVDFDSYFSLGILDQLARQAGSRVVMQEMLPDHEQLWLRTAEGSFVTEQTIELTRVENRPGK